MNIRDLIPYMDEGQLTECLENDAFIVPHNPYNSIYPNRTTFRSYDVDLMKLLAKNGYRINTPKFKANDKDKKEVLLQKHFDLSDPMILFLVGIPFQLVISLIAGFIVYLTTRKKKTPYIFIVQTKKDGEIEGCYNENGQSIPKEEIQKTLSKLQDTPVFSTPNINSEFPVPIYLEHSSKVVGWGNCYVDEKGLRVEARIDDELTKQQVETGKLVGFSIGGIAKKYMCSICQRDYFVCPHIRGETYEGQEAYINIEEIDLAEISIVSNPTFADYHISQTDTKND